jgi:ABC-type glycerol-3-phosphate transport system substrate-binding protein
MAKRIAVGAALALALAACGTGVNAQSATPTVTHAHHISEDSPGWDCATMGNGKCGPGPVNAQ